MLPKAVRLVTFAWGEQHVKDMLNYALASALAPGNLPAMARRFDCTVAVVTEAALFDVVRDSETGRKIQDVCPLKLIALDDLLAEPWQYGMTLTRALFRGMEDLGPAMTETYFLFLNSDFILSDGSYERLIPRIEAGERLHLSPSYCTVEEAVGPILRERFENGALSLPPRELASLILEYRHNTIKAKTVNQDTLEFEHADQFYWAVDENTLLGHQMPIAVVGMQPTVALRDVSTFWDWGLIYDFCPDKPLCVIGDSDEFLMLELRPQMRSAEHILLGRSSPRAVAKRMTGYITQYQVDNAKFPLTLHSQDLPAGIPSARLQLKSYVETVLRNLPSKPIEHSNHAQWRYHTKYFRQRLAKRYLGYHRPRKGAKPVFKPVSFEEPPLTSKAAFLRRLAGIGHPYHELIGSLKAWSATSPYPIHILAVCERGSLLLRFLDDLPGLQTHLTPELVLDGALAFWPKEVSRFDLCLVEAPAGELAAKATELAEAILSHVTETGRISLLWYAGSNLNQKPLVTAAVKLMSQRRVELELQYRSSPLAALGHQSMRFAHHTTRLGSLGRPLQKPALLSGLLSLILARLLAKPAYGRRLSGKRQTSLGADCIGFMINLKPTGGRARRMELLGLSKRQAALSREPSHGDLFYNVDAQFTKWLVKSDALESDFALVAFEAEERRVARFRVLDDRLVVHRLGFGRQILSSDAPSLRQKGPREYFHSLEKAVDEPALGSFRENFALERRGKQSASGPWKAVGTYLQSGTISAVDFLTVTVGGEDISAPEEVGAVAEFALLGIDASIRPSKAYTKPAADARAAHFPAADAFCSRGFRLYDLNFDRFVRPAYLAARSQLYGGGANLDAGIPSTFNCLFCRELPESGKSKRRRAEGPAAVDQILKLLVICELYGIKDIAVEMLLAHASELEKRIDLEKGLALLCA